MKILHPEQRVPAETAFTMANLLDQAVLTHPEKDALVYNDQRITYEQLDRNINRTANMLLSKGVQPQERVGIISHNRPHYLEAMFACARINAVVVNINWRLSPKELYNMLVSNDIRIAFIDLRNPEWTATLKELVGTEIELIGLDMPNGGKSELSILREQYPDTRPECPVTSEDIFCHIHTSGTTGMPKCAMHSHATMVLQTTNMVKLYGLETGNIFLFTAQMFHVAILGVYAHLLLGNTIILMEKFDPEACLKLVQTERVTHLNTIPPVLNWIIQQYKKTPYDTSSLAVVTYSSCIMPKAVLDEANALLKCGFIGIYGMTELAGLVTILNQEDHIANNYEHLYSVGRPIPDCVIKVIGEDGRVCAPGEIGEVIVDTPALLKGFYKRPEAMEKAVIDGWLHTGDMGYLDYAGFLYIQGRKDDMVISGGENIYPKEIEDALMELEDDISEAAVFGVPDKRWGEVALGCVVLQEGSKHTEDTLKTYLRGRIAHFKVPKRIFIVDEIPHNSVGKVSKKTLEEQYKDEMIKK